MIEKDELAGLDLPELLAASRLLLEELASRVSDPRLLDAVDRFPDGSDHDRSEEWGLYAHADRVLDEKGDADPSQLLSGKALNDESLGGDSLGATAEAVPAGCLPVVLSRVEELGRWVDAARTGLAGHVDGVFEEHATRRGMLGIPEGKCAYRNGVDYLQQVLHVPRHEARKRVRRAIRVMPRLTPDRTQVIQPEMTALAGTVISAQADPVAVDTVVDALTSARADAGRAGAPKDHIELLIAEGERVLAAQAREMDPDALRKVCAYWRQRFDAVVNPDGLEPTEAQMNAAQGLFYHGKGTANLHRWSLLATDGQHETLKTLVSASSNPRRYSDDGSGSEVWAEHLDVADSLDSRSRAQRELDGLISALTGALALTNQTTPTAEEGGSDLPDSGSGGVRPQVLVTIDYESLAGHYTSVKGQGAAGHVVSQAAYAGAVDPQTIRQKACDADLIPIVLGGSGEVLDVGRAQRLFTRKLRRAIVARDGGCAAPACSIPAPWCEAHHIRFWEHGGPTSVENGVLLCSHHHHAVHAGAWEIEVKDGVPWFIPARYHDPEQRPRRNHYWRPRDPGSPGNQGPGVPGGPGRRDNLDDAA
ncbi:DUF222 domain-containing protein [Citricoccus sp.]|uniref:HNH endonuclease signature motif containing protein n=1 Tax=Citricoccus sp. TaxID=1978372 RepID=UPI0028BDE511|nr:DUF222 domain-containing protein [Citricoccus sp.]